jgi:hypothetical protein
VDVRQLAWWLATRSPLVTLIVAASTQDLPLLLMGPGKRRYPSEGTRLHQVDSHQVSHQH